MPSSVSALSGRAALFLLVSSALASAALAATITVETNSGADLDDADCSLPEAIVAANTDAAYHGCAGGSGTDRIEFDLVTPATITLTADLPAITDDLAILGPGIDELTLEGDDLYSILFVNSPSGGADLYAVDLTVAHGSAGPQADPLAYRSGGAAISPGDRGIFVRVRFLENQSSNSGGGLFLNSLGPAEPAIAYVDQCIFEGNIAQGPSGGAGIYATNGTILTILRSTLTGNFASASAGGGGGLRMISSTVTIRRSTISGNDANGSGGGITLSTTEVGPTALTITDSTIVGNRAGLLAPASNGGGILVTPDNVGTTPTTVTLRNSIVAGNSDGQTPFYPDFAVLSSTNLTVISNGYNLIGKNDSTVVSFAAGTPNGAGDFVGTSAAPLEALLDALGDNGGPTPTHLPSEDAASWVVDHGDCLSNSGDQRDYVDATSGLRPVDNATVANHVASDGCDIGAAELGAVPGDFVFADDFESGTTFAWSSAVP